MLHNIQIRGGLDKDGRPEAVTELTLERGHIYTIIGRTGSGKTHLLEDIESLNNGEGQSQRVILINGQPPDESFLQGYRSSLIAHLSQKMNYVMDMGVLDFLILREQLKSPAGHEQNALQVLEQANLLSGETIEPLNQLTSLSGGQSRALMIADVAFNASAPVILIDEVENAGIDKRKALALLAKRDKIVVVVTHDPFIAFYGHARIMLARGGMTKVIERTASELHLLNRLNTTYDKLEDLRREIRSGKSWGEEDQYDLLQL